MLLGQPDANVVIASKAVRIVQFFLEGRQRRRGNTLVDRGQGHLIAEGTGSTALGIGPKPRGHAVPMYPQQRGNLLALSRLAAGGEVQRMEPLPLLPIGFAFHAALELVGAFGNSGQCFSHAVLLCCVGDREA
jgi:hypothetical protein